MACIALAVPADAAETFGEHGTHARITMKRSHAASSLAETHLETLLMRH